MHAPLRSLLAEEAQVDLEYGLEEAHVGTLVKTNCMFPHVDEEDLARCQGEQRRLALKVLSRFASALTLQHTHNRSRTWTNLILAALAAIGALDVHDHQIEALGATHPDTLAR